MYLQRPENNILSSAKKNKLKIRMPVVHRDLVSLFLMKSLMDIFPHHSASTHTKPAMSHREFLHYTKCTEFCKAICKHKQQTIDDPHSHKYMFFSVAKSRSIAKTEWKITPKESLLLKKGCITHAVKGNLYLRLWYCVSVANERVFEQLFEGTCIHGE